MFFGLRFQFTQFLIRCKFDHLKIRSVFRRLKTWQELSIKCFLSFFTSSKRRRGEPVKAAWHRNVWSQGHRVHLWCRERWNRCGQLNGSLESDKIKNQTQAHLLHRQALYPYVTIATQRFVGFYSDAIVILFQLGLEGSVPLEKTSYQSAFPVRWTHTPSKQRCHVMREGIWRTELKIGGSC